MALRKYEDTVGGKFSDEDWDHNVDEIESRLTNAQSTANNAVLKVWTAGNQAAMLGLTDAKRGHFARRTDVTGYYVLTAADYTVLGNWLYVGNYEANLKESDRFRIFDVADNTGRDALTPNKGDKARVTSTGMVYQWNGTTWVFVGYYIFGDDQLTGTIGQDKVTNLSTDLTDIQTAIDVLEQIAAGAIKQYRYVLRYSQLAGGSGTSDTRNIFPLEPNTVIHAVKVFTKEAWTSGTNSVFNTRVFYDTIDLVAAASSMALNTQRVSNTMVACAPAGGDAVRIEVSTDTDITDWTAGAIMVFIYYSNNDITE